MSAKERPIISTLINVAMWFERTAPPRQSLEGDRRPPYPEKQRQLVLRFREYDPPLLHDPGTDRDLVGLGLYPVGQRSVPKP